MGARIQIRAFKQSDDKMEVIIGFEGDNCETSILVMKEGDKCSRLHTFVGDKFSTYDKNWQYYISANKNNEAREYVVENFASSDSSFLKKLGERIKVGDYYYDDEELRTLIHGLRAVLPYFRNGSKNNYIRHLQWHNVNQEQFVLPQEAAPTTAPPKPHYETWGTW